MSRKANIDLNEKRMNCAIRSFSLTANYVGLADGKFDEKEKEEAKNATAIFSNWDSLFYMDKEDIDEDQLRARISEEIVSIADSGDSSTTMLDELKQQFEVAKTLTKYPELLDKAWGGTADYEKDVSTYASRDALKKIIKAESLEVDEEDCKSEDGFDLDQFHGLVVGELSDPFSLELGNVLCIFGCSIAAASGGFMGIGKMRSNSEVQAIYDIEKSWGGSESSADYTMMFYDMRAKAVKEMRKALRKMF